MELNKFCTPISPIWLLYRFRARLESLRRFAKGNNRDYIPKSPIVFFYRFRVSLERLRSFDNGDNSD